jgi:hypothetical protein
MQNWKSLLFVGVLIAIVYFAGGTGPQTSNASSYNAWYDGPVTTLGNTLWDRAETTLTRGVNISFNGPEGGYDLDSSLKIPINVERPPVESSPKEVVSNKSPDDIILVQECSKDGKICRRFNLLRKNWDTYRWNTDVYDYKTITVTRQIDKSSSGVCPCNCPDCICNKSSANQIQTRQVIPQSNVVYTSIVPYSNPYYYTTPTRYAAGYSGFRSSGGGFWFPGKLLARRIFNTFENVRARRMERFASYSQPVQMNANYSTYSVCSTCY